MELYIDCGNTNVCFALGMPPPRDHLMKEGLIGHLWRCKTDRERCADEYWAFLRAMLDSLSQRPSINRLVLSSVVPEATEQLLEMAHLHLPCKVMVIDFPLMTEFLRIELDEPHASVGADRMLNAFAGHVLSPHGAVVIDFGTATTFDVVVQGGYKGGLICPGLMASRDALKQRTSLLPSITLGMPKRVVGTNTVDAMKSGIMWGYVGMIEGLVTRVQKETGVKTVLSTGGLSVMFEKMTPSLGIVDPLLTVRAMAAVSSLRP